MSDAEHLIENAIMALERYPYEEAERYFMEAPINIMMAKDSGCPLNAVWEMAIYCDTTLRQYWKEEWEKEAERWIPVTERLPEAKVDVLAVMHYKDGRTAVNQGWYSALNEQWYIGVAGIHAPVTHWMPLPDAPEEGER